MLFTNEFLTPSLFFLAGPADAFEADFFGELRGADFLETDFLDADLFVVPAAVFFPADLGAAVFFADFFEAGLPAFLAGAFPPVFLAVGIALN